MNFQKFCNKAQDIDQQEVTTGSSFAISFKKPGGSAFSVDPKDIILFLELLLENHESCKKIIESDPRFLESKTYLNYQEKPYRALYSYAGDHGLKTISSLGGSQTKELTKVISKLLTYLANIEYVDVSENTYFDEESLILAIKNAPADFLTLGVPENNLSEGNKYKFIDWLKSKNLSESTVRKYSQDSMVLADKILKKNNILLVEIYKINENSKIKSLSNWLSENTEWKEKNSTGNGMFQAGLNKYIEFLDENLHLTPLPKPFLLLAGISGTGKTRFVREQARKHNSGSNFCLVPVRPDWHEPSDLLGYISRIGEVPKYISTKTLQFIIQAWREIAPEADIHGMGALNAAAPPYWLCLDEMNLAPVEQYFADYLSVLESRKFDGDVYQCDPLLDKNLLLTSGIDCRGDLGLQSAEDQGLWEFFCQHGIPLPPNLIVAGTVNMDETTHGFSRKVIDRALTFDFGEFFPNDFQSLFTGQSLPKTLTYSLQTHASLEQLSSTADPDGQLTIGFLDSVNNILRQTPFELAYRALNELLLHVACFDPQDLEALQAVWDDFLMTKVLPRIDGDEDKLRFAGGGADNVLVALEIKLAQLLDLIWSDDKGRKDLFRETHDGNEITGMPCRSRRKLAWMKKRLEANTFTSFWP